MKMREGSKENKEGAGEKEVYRGCKMAVGRASARKLKSLKRHTGCNGKPRQKKGRLRGRQKRERETFRRSSWSTD